MNGDRELKEVFDFYAKGDDPKNKYIYFSDIVSIIEKMEL